MKSMTKYIKFMALAMVLLFAFTACGGNDEGKKTDETKETEKKIELEKIVVASHKAPMTDILDLIKDDLKDEGYELEIFPVSDNVQANVALNDKEVDANFFQHKLFMQMFNEGNDANLVAIQPVYNAIVAFYGKDIKSIDDIKDGATVAVPSDPTNMARALRMMAHYGVITLNEPDSYKITIEDIVENPKTLQIEGIGLLNLNEAYNEKDLVFNYPTYIAALDLKPEKDGIMIEEADDTFAISLVAREDNKDSDKIKALKKAISSEKVRKFIEENLKGHAIVSF